MNSSLVSTTETRRKLFGFSGGVHPEEMKSVSNQTAITKAPMPPKLILPLQQHIGNPPELLVETGQTVLKGQKIAEAQGLISAALHAPTSGTIGLILDHPVAHPSGMSDRCVELIPDGKDQWCQLQTCEHYEQLSIAEVQAKVRDAGITGMGGAGFPTQVKLQPPSHDKVATLILNAAECEPYITSDDRLMQERAYEVVRGLEIMAYVLKPGECLIGIEDNKPQAIAELRKAVIGTQIEIVVIPTKYPSGGEKQLIKILTGKEVPHGKIPADIGVMCQNVATSAAVYRAIRFGEPLISRITTLTGDCISQKGNVEVLIGTPVNWLLEHYGYQKSNSERVIAGGPMMGFTLENLQAPIVKTSNCILAPSASELPMPPPALACIRCSQCADVCPAELLPQQLYWFARAEEYDKAEHHNLMDCIECGACSYVCPSAIPLVQYYRHAKGQIRQQRHQRQKSDQARLRFESRQQRLEREAAEKAARRKERAAAAAKAQAAKKVAEKPAPAAPAQDVPKPAESPKPAKTIAAPVVDIVVDINALTTTLEKAQAKLEKMQQTLDDAIANQPELVEKLSRAVEKNKARVESAKQALNDARSQSASGENS